MSAKPDDSRDSGEPVAIRYLDAEAIAAVPYGRVTDALIAAFTAGLDPAVSAPRTIVPVRAGQLLLMPAELPGYAGVKVVGVAPDNPMRGMPRILGTFLLMDGESLRPLAIMDGTALTTLRTPAVSAAAARFLAPRKPCRLVVFGAGPQAAGHIRALSGERELSEIVVITRTVERSASLAETMDHELGIPARAGGATDVGDADIVVCATTAREPLFSAEAVQRGALVIAVGSHEPDVVECDPALLVRSQVVVEDAATALREAGEVVSAVAHNHLDAAVLTGLRDIVTGACQPDFTRTRVFKSVGMGWEDLVVAALAFGYRGEPSRERRRGHNQEQGA
ncbi:MAG: ornithine cyclodeaminase family protein [Nakamurella sp.]